MTRFHRRFSLLLVLLMMLPLSACSETTAGDEGTPAADTPVLSDAEVTETEAETEDPWYGLPEADFGGRTYTILTSNWPGEAVWTVDDFTAEELTGEPLNDAVYNRNTSVEDRLNCVVAEANMVGKPEAEAALKNSVAAQDEAYQVWVPRLQEYISIASGGYIQDLQDVAGIDFANKAWVQNSIEGLSILGHNFAVCNEMMTIHKEAVSSIIFNKNLAEQYQIEDPYTVVTDDRWTLDYFAAVVQQVSADLNGDGKMTDADQWGFLYQRDTLDAFLAAGNGKLCEKDENDYPIYAYDSENTITILMKVTDLVYDQNICYNVMNAAGDFNVWMANKFMADEAMFMWVRDVNIPQLRTMESDFGILPNPKYNETIDNYYSIVNSYTGAALSIPKIGNAEYAETVGLFVETMGAASLTTLSVAYYDTLLNGIVARDQESQQMLDIIYANTTYDPGSIGAYSSINDYIYMAMTYDQNFASNAASRKKAVEKVITRTCEKIAEEYGG